MTDFNVGDIVLYSGFRMRVVDPAFKGEITLIDLMDNSALVQAPVADVILAPALPVRPTDLNTEAWRSLEARAKAVREIVAAATSEEAKKVRERHAKALGLSIRTLQRDEEKFKNAQIPCVAALKPEKSGRPIGLRMLSLDVEAIISRQLNEKWLVPNQPHLSDIADQIQSECRNKGLAVPCITTIRKRAQAIDDYERLAKRQGTKKAKYKLKPLVGHIQAAFALEIVQVDHTLADVILVSEENRTIPIGRPWVTLAICVATKVIVGLYITFEPPSAISVAMCLVNAIRPKEQFLASLGLKGRWPVSGVMQRLHLDNGRDFHSEALQRGCSQLGINIEYRPVGSPHYGGVIERLMGTFMGRCRLLPGATQSNVVKRGDYDAEGKAVMTLKEFKAFFVNEVVNVYHVKEHRTLGVPPVVKWDELQSSSSEKSIAPPGWEHWMLQTTFYPFEKRLIRRDGVHLFSRQYWADGLEEWIGDGIERPIAYDPGDLSRVFIQGPNGIPLIAYDTRDSACDLSRYEMDHQRAQQKLLGQSPDLLAQLDQGLSTRQELVKKASKETKKVHRQKAIAIGKTERGAIVPDELVSPVITAALGAHAALNFDAPVKAITIYRKGS